jgi:hypothetical protein
MLVEMWKQKGGRGRKGEVQSLHGWRRGSRVGGARRFRSGGWDPRGRGRILGRGASIGVPLCRCQANVVEKSKRSSVRPSSSAESPVTSTHRRRLSALPEPKLKFPRKANMRQKNSRESNIKTLSSQRQRVLKSKTRVSLWREPVSWNPCSSKGNCGKCGCDSRFPCCKWTE